MPSVLSFFLFVLSEVLEIFHSEVKYQLPDGFVGLVVSVLASGTRVHGFNPG
jgi:hypothetical protein